MKMKIEGTGLEGKEMMLEDLDYNMEELGFLRWSWDYKRATYDYKYVDHKSGETIYLRVPCVAVEGEIEDGANHSVLQLEEPYIGRHTYPHGLDYEYNFPNHIMDNVKRKLKALNDRLAAV